VSRPKPKPKPAPHVFVADPDVPADPITGAEVCRCGLVGHAGDAHHTMPEPTADAASAAAGEVKR
jgi:hypothetical protein